MTNEERLAALKPGDVVKRKGWSRDWLVLAKIGSTAYVCATDALSGVYPIAASDIAWPEAPKAIPGRMYRNHRYGMSSVLVAYGTPDGRLRHLPYLQYKPFDLTPEWTLVEEGQ